MYYIVLDLDRNQPWPVFPSAQKAAPGSDSWRNHPDRRRAETPEDQTVADELQLYVKPRYYRRLNKRVSKLTGIKESKLKAEGLDFPDAIEVFHRWCGDDCIFLTWGFDDIGILTENLRLFQLDAQWVQNWYNAQMMYNAQIGGGTQQKALKTALEEMGIAATRPAHDALGDAYHTACICARLDLPRAWPNTAAPSKRMRMGSTVHRFPAASAAKSTTALPASRTHLPIWPVLKTAAPPAARR